MTILLTGIISLFVGMYLGLHVFVGRIKKVLTKEESDEIIRRINCK